LADTMRGGLPEKVETKVASKPVGRLPGPSDGNHPPVSWNFDGLARSKNSADGEGARPDSFPTPYPWVANAFIASVADNLSQEEVFRFFAVDGSSVGDVWLRAEVKASRGGEDGDGHQADDEKMRRHAHSPSSLAVYEKSLKLLVGEFSVWRHGPCCSPSL